MTASFMWEYNSKLYPEDFFFDKSDRKIVGNPCIAEGDRYWNSYYVLSSCGELYRGISLVSNFWEKYISKKFELQLQDLLPTSEIISTPNGNFSYYRGEIIVECFVKYNTPCDTEYRSVLNTRHLRNDLGYIVGIRVLNSQELVEKYDFRYCVLESEWKLFGIDKNLVPIPASCNLETLKSWGFIAEGEREEFVLYRLPNGWSLIKDTWNTKIVDSKGKEKITGKSFSRLQLLV